MFPEVLSFYPKFRISENFLKSGNSETYKGKQFSARKKKKKNLLTKLLVLTDLGRMLNLNRPTNSFY